VREIYFHKNSVLGRAFPRLKVGTTVRFAEEQGERGPQASTVHVVPKEQFTERLRDAAAWIEFETDGTWHPATATEQRV